MEMSPAIDALAAALAQAQPNILGAAKDSVNPHLKNRYADLSSVMDACKGALNAEGISILQLNEPSDPQTIRVRTMLLHKSGQWISGTIVIPATKSDPQGYGSAQTYARRYGLMAIVGVCPEDDDGEAAKVAPSKPAPQAPQAQGPAMASAQQLKWIHAWMTRNKVLDRNEGLQIISSAAGRNVESSKDLSALEASHVIDALAKSDEEAA